MAFVKAAPTMTASLTGSTNFEHFSITISPPSFPAVSSEPPQNHQRPLKCSEVSLTSFINKRNSHTENKKENKSGRAKSKAVAVGCSQPGRQAGRHGPSSTSTKNWNYQGG